MVTAKRIQVMCFEVIFEISSERNLLIWWGKGGRPGISVTRFSQISPLWQKFRSHRRLFEALISVSLNFEPALANILCHWANLIASNSVILTNNLAIWLHCRALIIRWRGLQPNYLRFKCQIFSYFDDLWLMLRLLSKTLAMSWCPLVLGDEGWIGPSRKLLCLC